jgi:hypothetical protein
MARVGIKIWLIAPAIFGKLILKIVKNEFKHFQNTNKEQLQLFLQFRSAEHHLFAI